MWSSTPNSQLPTLKARSRRTGDSPWELVVGSWKLIMASQRKPPARRSQRACHRSIIRPCRGCGRRVLAADALGALLRERGRAARPGHSKTTSSSSRRRRRAAAGIRPRARCSRCIERTGWRGSSKCRTCPAPPARSGCRSSSTPDAATDGSLLVTGLVMVGATLWNDSPVSVVAGDADCPAHRRVRSHRRAGGVAARRHAARWSRRSAAGPRRSPGAAARRAAPITSWPD